MAKTKEYFFVIFFNKILKLSFDKILILYKVFITGVLFITHFYDKFFVWTVKEKRPLFRGESRRTPGVMRRWMPILISKHVTAT